jgi:hypothetical protein
MGLLAIDQSLTRSGWCFIPGSRFVMEEMATGSYASMDAGGFCVKTLELIKDLKPQFVVYERPLNVIMQYGKKQLTEDRMVTPNADQLHLHRIAGMIDGIGAALDIDVMDVPPATWRARILGNGRMSGAASKQAARVYCQRLGAAQRNHDQAEAVCIAMYGVTSPEYRYHLTRLKG